MGLDSGEGHDMGLGWGYLVMRYIIKIRIVEKTTCLNSKVRTLYMR